MSITYGRCWLEGSAWRIEAQPHILLRLKRIFERIDKGQRGIVALANTPENCRDLEWFRQRYPLALSPGHERLLVLGARRHEDHILFMEDLVGPAHQARPFKLALPPRHYQAQAAEMLLAQGHLLLCDELGLGKTCTAICTLTEPRALPAVVVCYPFLQRQWQAEIKKFAPGLRTHILKCGTPYPIPAGTDVILTSYHKLGGWAEVLSRWAHSIIFDEVQELRHGGSTKYTAAAHIGMRARYRMGLTATPIYNYGGEMFNILEVLAPGKLGTFAEFWREWCPGSYMDKARVADPKAFGTYLRENFLMLRRTRSDVGRELPAVTRIPHRIDCDRKALEDVSESAAELARIILAQAQDWQGQKMNASERLSNVLRQATGIAKAPHVADFVRLIVESGEKVIVAGWHREVYTLWQDKLLDLHPAWFTGSEPPGMKEAEKERFVKGETNVLFLSLRSGAGLDGLQEVCRTVVFGELDWSPGVHEQVIGRVHRDGQASPVTAYFLVSEEGADPVMAEVLGLKREQLEGVRNPTADLVEKLETGTENAKKLAEHYLRKHGKGATTAEVA